MTKLQPSKLLVWRADDKLFYDLLMRVSFFVAEMNGGDVTSMRQCYFVIHVLTSGDFRCPAFVRDDRKQRRLP